MRFADQETDLRRMLQALPIARLCIDQSGIGMNLAENLAAEFPQVVRENFTNANKERWATDFKILLQRRRLALPKDRNLIAQIHSIKRRVLGSSQVAFDADRTTRHGHADRFRALAMACQQERQRPVASGGITARILGSHDADQPQPHHQSDRHRGALNPAAQRPSL